MKKLHAKLLQTISMSENKRLNAFNIVFFFCLNEKKQTQKIASKWGCASSWQTCTIEIDSNLLTIFDYLTILLVLFCAPHSPCTRQTTKKLVLLIIIFSFFEWLFLNERSRRLRRKNHNNEIYEEKITQSSTCVLPFCVMFKIC